MQPPPYTPPKRKMPPAVKQLQQALASLARATLKAEAGADDGSDVSGGDESGSEDDDEDDAGGATDK